MRLNNQIRTWILFTSTSLIIIALCNYQWGRNGLLWSFAFLFTSHSLFYFLGELRIKNHFKAQPLEGRDPWGIHELTQDLCEKSRIKLPSIYLIPIQHCQSFTLSKGFSDSEIYFTQGLLELLNPKELEGIISLQIANIKSRNVQAYTLMGSLAAVFLYISYKLDSFFSWLVSKRNHLNVVQNQGGFFTWMATMFLALMFKLVFRKNDSLKIDKTAADLMGDPDSLASALWKMDSYSKTQPLKVPLHFTHYFVVNPQHRGRFKHSFETQPSVTQRINNLVGHYPL